MPKDVPVTFIASKNAETNQPVWLYQIHTGLAASPVGDLFLAEYHEQIEFPTASGNFWEPFPIEHRGIGENTGGQVDSLDIVVSNVDRSMQSQLENRDGLRGYKVTIRQVFIDKLGSLDNAVLDVFYIDSTHATQDTITFRLTSRLDLLQAEVPNRRFSRTFCQWRYKLEGCWESDGAGGWQAPSGWITSGTFDPGGPDEFVFGDECKKTLQWCEYHNNVFRHGAFPSIPHRSRFFL